MSLCALIYKDTKPISSSTDLVKIMNIGNELYSILSRLCNQSFLLLTELPTMHVTVQEINYQLDYSECYTGSLHNNSYIPGFMFSMSLDNAIQSLIDQRYNSFLLTIGCETVGIYCTADTAFEVFDSHAKNLCGLPDSQGTCESQ